MSLDEFGIIATYFSRHQQQSDIELSIGDDCAVLKPPAGKRLLVTIDTLNEGSHFFPDTLPFDIGYKSVAVSLSDIAAMGGEPLWALGALSIRNADDAWLASFSDGLYTCLDDYRVTLVGGNLTKGALSVTTQIIGCATPGQYLTRGGAKPGDYIFVTGCIGEGGLALALLQRRNQFPAVTNHLYEQITRRLWHPKPRISEGQLLVNLATAAIDISDGLIADLKHILKASSVGATIEVGDLPLAPFFEQLPEEMKTMALTSGDDYELCFTIPEKHLKELEAISKQTNCLMTCIGRIEAGNELQVLNQGLPIKVSTEGYKHF